MKVNFVETYDTMNFGDVALGDVFLDAELLDMEEKVRYIFIKIDTSNCDDNAYNLTENFKACFDENDRVYVLKAELNVLLESR